MGTQCHTKILTVITQVNSKFKNISLAHSQLLASFT